jgi:hypothetical protein
MRAIKFAVARGSVRDGGSFAKTGTTSPSTDPSCFGRTARNFIEPPLYDV